MNKYSLRGNVFLSQMFWREPVSILSGSHGKQKIKIIKVMRSQLDQNFPNDFGFFLKVFVGRLLGFKHLLTSSYIFWETNFLWSALQERRIADLIIQKLGFPEEETEIWGNKGTWPMLSDRPGATKDPHSKPICFNLHVGGIFQSNFIWNYYIEQTKPSIVLIQHFSFYQASVSVIGSSKQKISFCVSKNRVGEWVSEWVSVCLSVSRGSCIHPQQRQRHSE